MSETNSTDSGKEKFAEIKDKIDEKVDNVDTSKLHEFKGKAEEKFNQFKDKIDEKLHKE